MSKIESEYVDLDKHKDYYENIIYYKKDTQLIHNPYGPAKIYTNGKKFYYINGKELTKEEFEYHPDRLKFLGKEHLMCLV